jgi:hypothetical protein
MKDLEKAIADSSIFEKGNKFMLQRKILYE